MGPHCTLLGVTSHTPPYPTPYQSLHPARGCPPLLHPRTPQPAAIPPRPIIHCRTAFPPFSSIPPYHSRTLPFVAVLICSPTVLC
ncbi:hypothetical protein BD779DRAFT_169085 [Infundibulicybe gibba]|nr:hypothetical protein BD779DRAFT_169085 [Infundibulicybe gibba]